MGRGHVRIEEQAVEGNSSKWRPVVRQGCKGEMAPCQSEERDSWDGSDLIRLSPFFKPVQKGFPRFA